MSDTHHETRQRLLETAGQVFAESGFRAATVREICRRAKANVASVNYHFGDKERLYSEVLLYASLCASEKYNPLKAVDPSVPAAKRLECYIRHFLAKIFDEGRPAWHGKLMAREMAEPTKAFDELIVKEVRPNSEMLVGIVKELLGPAGRDPALVRRSVLSVVGQCIFYQHSRPFLARLFPNETMDVEGLAKHITRFSLAALRTIAKEKNFSREKSR
jgi:TetR/AcrR family transcriptional regulator, regulator of cefoperazone and chloramphenicol sensitivity